MFADLILLADSKNVVYTRSLTGGVAGFYDTPVAGKLRPGEKLSAKVAFVVPRSCKPKELYFPVDAAGPPLRIDLLRAPAQ